MAGTDQCDQCQVSDLEQLNQFVRLQVIGTARHTNRRVKLVMVWMAVLTAVSVVSLGVAVATVMMIYGR
jgi:hypothetical protein